MSEMFFLNCGVKSISGMLLDLGRFMRFTLDDAATGSSAIALMNVLTCGMDPTPAA